MLKVKKGTIADDCLAHVLFYNHITPNSTTELSPAELLQGRRLRSRLDLVKPDIQARIERKQYHHPTSKATGRSFSSGDIVYVRNFRSGTTWIPGTIESAIGNVSYEVMLEDSRMVRRHVDHIRQRWKDSGNDCVPRVVSLEEESLSTPSVESSIESSIKSSVESSIESSIESSVESTTEQSSTDFTVQSSVETNTSTAITDPDSQKESRRYPGRTHRRPDFYLPTDFRRKKTVMN